MAASRIQSHFRGIREARAMKQARAVCAVLLLSLACMAMSNCHCAHDDKWHCSQTESEDRTVCTVTTTLDDI